MEMLEIDKSSRHKHDRLEQQETDIAIGIILGNAKQELLKVQHRHETVHPFDIAPQQLVPQPRFRH